MSYKVFARKYRPQRFGDVVGQEAIARTLRNAVEQGRVAHAYLFAGPRGVGKTSMARILAKALNCAAPEGGEPCNRCPSCESITEGRNFDVDEFDAASNRKVEDAEALIQRVRAPRPARVDSRFKVFIVDEVHMMTNHAFNALLKTLEEPPAHVKFIFATTEPEAVPETILSRCQRFDFKRIGREDAVKRLRAICAEEGIEADDAALRLIARRARGGMRDAQSLLDQAVALCGKRLAQAELEAALGMAPRERVRALLDAVSRGDVGGALSAIDATFADGLDAAELCAQAAKMARDCMVLAACGRERGAAVLDEPEDAEDLAPLAERLGCERAMHVVGAIAALEKDVQAARDDRVLIELCFVKLARLPDLVPLPEAVERLARIEAALGGAPLPARAPDPAPAVARSPDPAPAQALAPAPAPVAAPAPAPSFAPAPATVRAPASSLPPVASRTAAYGPAAEAPPAPPVAPRPAGPAEIEAAVRKLAGRYQVLEAAARRELREGALYFEFETKFELDRFEKDARPALERALGLPVAGRLAAKPPARRRTHQDVAADPDVRRVIEHTRGTLVDWKEDEQP